MRHATTRHLVLLTLAAQLLGCALDVRVARATAAHTYATSCDDLAPAVRDALGALDDDIERVEASDALVLRTGWRRPNPVPKIGVATRFRYAARMSPARVSGCRLRVEREQERDGQVTTARDLDLEWEVLRSADPLAARRIEGGAR